MVAVLCNDNVELVVIELNFKHSFLTLEIYWKIDAW